MHLELIVQKGRDDRRDDPVGLGCAIVEDLRLGVHGVVFADDAAGWLGGHPDLPPGVLQTRNRTRTPSSLVRPGGLASALALALDDAVGPLREEPLAGGGGADAGAEADMFCGIFGVDVLAEGALVVIKEADGLGRAPFLFPRAGARVLPFFVKAETKALAFSSMALSSASSLLPSSSSSTSMGSSSSPSWRTGVLGRGYERSLRTSRMRLSVKDSTKFVIRFEGFSAIKRASFSFSCSICFWRESWSFLRSARNWVTVAAYRASARLRASSKLATVSSAGGSKPSSSTSGWQMPSSHAPRKCSLVIAGLTLSRCETEAARCWFLWN